MLTLVIFLGILSILILVHEFGHFIVAKKLGVRIEQFSLGFGPVIFKKKKKETEYSLSAIPLGGFVKLAGDNLEEFTGKPDEYFSQAPGKRFWIIFCGPLLNYILGILFFWMIFFVGYPTLTTKIGGLVDGFGAQEAGLKVGDKILAVDGKKTEYWEDLQSSIYSQKEQSYVQLSVLRDGKEFSAKVRIKEKQLDDSTGTKRNFGILGVTPFDEIVIVKHGFWESSGLGVSKTLELTKLTYMALGRLVSGRLSVRESMTGPLGIFFITSKAARMGVIAVLNLMAVLSISLAIFNLLPFPVLDGGHIFLLFIEKIRKKTLNLKTEQIINKIGISFIIFLAVFVTYNDIVRNFGPQIAKFFLK